MRKKAKKDLPKEINACRIKVDKADFCAKNDESAFRVS